LNGPTGLAAADRHGNSDQNGRLWVLLSDVAPGAPLPARSLDEHGATSSSDVGAGARRPHRRHRRSALDVATAATADAPGI
jgi:hypothetical protein